MIATKSFTVGLVIPIVTTLLMDQQIANPIILAIEHGEKLANLDFAEDILTNILNKNDEIGLLG